MFVLRFKPDAERLLYVKDKKGFESVNIGGRYFCDKPTRETGYTTTDIQQAKVFNDEEDKLSVRYFADTEVVEVKIVVV